MTIVSRRRKNISYSDGMEAKGARVGPRLLLEERGGVGGVSIQGRMGARVVSESL